MVLIRDWDLTKDGKKITAYVSSDGKAEIYAVYNVETDYLYLRETLPDTDRADIMIAFSSLYNAYRNRKVMIGEDYWAG